VKIGGSLVYPINVLCLRRGFQGGSRTDGSRNVISSIGGQDPKREKGKR